MWNWISHFASEKQFTRDGVRMEAWAERPDQLGNMGCREHHEKHQV